MQEYGNISPFAEALFDAYDKKNIVEEAHKRALGYQALLRDLYHFTDTDEMNELMLQATKELDELSGHMNQPVAVTGNVKVRSLDLRGIDTEAQTIDPEAIREKQVYVEKSTLQSLGYLIERTPDNISVSHLAGSGLEHTLSSPAYGDIYSTQRIYIPIDGTAYVELIDDEDDDELPLQRLEVCAQELVSDIDVAVLNAENLSDALRGLGSIDLSRYKNEIDDDDISTALVKYVNSILGTNGTLLYAIHGVESVSVKIDEYTYGVGSLDASVPAIGGIEGLVIDEQTNQFALLAEIPFSDNTRRTVVYELTPTITVDVQYSLRMSF